MILAAALTGAIGPIAKPLADVAVPAANAIGVTALVDETPSAAAQQTLSQQWKVSLAGRTLQLSLVTLGSSGVAVLTAPKNSLVPNLPDIETREFLELAAGASGCRPSGDVSRVPGQDGLLALSTGLACG